MMKIKGNDMIDHLHQKAFSLHLFSKERLLDAKEQAFLNEHFKTCTQCRYDAQISARLQASLKSHQSSLLHAYPQRPVPLLKIETSYDRNRKVRKAAHIAWSLSMAGLAVVLVVAVMGIFSGMLPIPSIPVFSGSEPPATGLVPSSISTPHPANGTPLGTTQTYVPQRTDVITYTVLLGDTLFKIADTFKLKPETILWSNIDTLGDGANIMLKPGLEIYILPVDGVYYEWQAGDDLNAVAAQLGVTPEDIFNWPGNHLKLETLGDLSRPNIKPGTMLVIPGGHLDFDSWDATPYP